MTLDMNSSLLRTKTNSTTRRPRRRKQTKRRGEEEDDKDKEDKDKEDEENKEKDKQTQYDKLFHGRMVSCLLWKSLTMDYSADIIWLACARKVL